MGRFMYWFMLTDYRIGRWYISGGTMQLLVK
jgi:hypothetical protein